MSEVVSCPCASRWAALGSGNSHPVLTVPPLLHPQRLCVLSAQPTKPQLWDDLGREANYVFLEEFLVSFFIDYREDVAIQAFWILLREERDDLSY